MKRDGKKLVTKLQDIKKTTRDRNIRIKLELFILALRLGNVSEACSRRGFGRTFYYKWWKRFVKSNYKLKALKEKSRRPKSSPKRTVYYWENKIRDYAQMGYGSPLIQALIKRDCNVHFARSTINHIINYRKKPKKTRERILKTRTRRYELPIPGQRLQLDVKYVPKFVEGKRLFSYVAIDECTRWRFAKAYSSLRATTTVEFLEELYRACPFPIYCIQTDNGHEFTFNHLGDNASKHPMDEWCEQRAIKHKLIPPMAKELNGKVERSHRIDEQFFYWKAPTNNVENFNIEYARWLAEYNELKPHQSLGWLTPKEKIVERLNSLESVKYDDEREWMRLQFLRKGSIGYLAKYGSYILKSAA